MTKQLAHGMLDCHQADTSLLFKRKTSNAVNTMMIKNETTARAAALPYCISVKAMRNISTTSVLVERPGPPFVIMNGYSNAFRPLITLSVRLIVMEVARRGRRIY